MLMLMRAYIMHMFLCMRTYACRILAEARASKNTLAEAHCNPSVLGETRALDQANSGRCTGHWVLTDAQDQAIFILKWSDISFRYRPAVNTDRAL